jgi:small subunit ribosomal protein S13
MARIVGINIPDNKHIEIALTSIYGIGRSLARKILLEAGLDFQKKAGELTQEEIANLKTIITKHAKIEGDLRREVSMNIKRLKDIKTWRGQRHSRGLPVRGQTTRINSRTVRGNVRRTMGSGRNKAPAPK